MRGSRAVAVVFGLLCCSGCMRDRVAEPQPDTAPHAQTAGDARSARVELGGAGGQPPPRAPTGSRGVAARQLRLPRGVPGVLVPADNPLTDPKIALGRRLFYDKRLSGNGRFSCATCHQQRRAFTDGRAQAIGSTGGRHLRSTMSLTNVAFNASFGWADGSVRSLEQQMMVPLFNEHPIEMGLTGRTDEVLARFSDDTGYVEEFRAAFPTHPIVSLSNAIKAIAAFERTLISGDSPFDRYLYRDDRGAMPPAALRGMDLFFSDRLRCATCHGGFNLSGPVTFVGTANPPLVFHNTGLTDPTNKFSRDRGLFEKTKRHEDMHRFRAPTLRNIAVTAPYMHDGSMPTLEAVIAHYASGGKPAPNKSPLLRPFRLSPAESSDLVAFLHSLTDERFLTNPAFADPVTARVSNREK